MSRVSVAAPSPRVKTEMAAQKANESRSAPGGCPEKRESNKPFNFPTKEAG